MSGTTRTILATVMMVFLLCAAEVTAQWEHFGLAGRRINSLEYYIFNPAYPGALCASTDSGLYKVRTDMPASVWFESGAYGKPVNTFAAVSYNTLLLARDTNTSPIYRSTDGGLNWRSAGFGFGGADPATVTRIETSPNIPTSYKYVLACGPGNVGISTNNGGNFTPVGEWGFLADFKFAKIDSLHSNIAYAGGMSGLWGPFLIKTADTCKTWSLLLEGYGAPANPAYDIAIHPTSPDTVWLVLENCIWKSTDSGYHWTSFYCPTPSFHFRAIEVDQRNPRCLYASGGYAPGPLTLFYSRDGGTTWNSISDTVQLEHPVNDIVLTAPDGAKNRIYFGTERGVFRYTETTSYCCVGETGNVDYKGLVDLGDLTRLVGYLVAGSPVICQDEANINGEGIIDLTDLSCLVSYLTGGGFVLPSCPQ